MAACSAPAGGALSLPGAVVAVRSPGWRLLVAASAAPLPAGGLHCPWACMSVPHRPRPHRTQPPRRRSAAHGSGSHHATPRPDLPPPSPADLPPVLPRFLPAAVLPPIMPSRPAEGFMRPVWYLDSLDIYAPYNPPNTAFSTKNHPGNLCKKTSPVPPKGGRGNGFGPIDGPKKCRYHSSQAKATRPRPPDPPPGTVQRGPSERADTAHGLGHPPKCPSERSGAARKGAGANRRRSNATVTVTAGTTGGSKKGPGRCA